MKLTLPRLQVAPGTPLRLVDLRPSWFAEPGRHGQGVVFDCPGCARGLCRSSSQGYKHRPARLAVAFDPPLDGGAPIPLGKWEALLQAISEDGDWTDVVPPGIHWQRKGSTFTSLSFTPSVNAERAGHWHGHITRGEVQ